MPLVSDPTANISSTVIRRSALKGGFERVFKSLSGERDFEYAIIDGTIIRVHQRGAGARGGLKIRRLADPA
jgi:hypothetical protein